MGPVDARVGDPAGAIPDSSGTCPWQREKWLASLVEPSEEAVAVLLEALEDEEELVREHAA